MLSKVEATWRLMGVISSDRFLIGEVGGVDSPCVRVGPNVNVTAVFVFGSAFCGLLGELVSTVPNSIACSIFELKSLVASFTN